MQLTRPATSASSRPSNTPSSRPATAAGRTRGRCARRRSPAGVSCPVLHVARAPQHVQHGVEAAHHSRAPPRRPGAPRRPARRGGGPRHGARSPAAPGRGGRGGDGTRIVLGTAWTERVLLGPRDGAAPGPGPADVGPAQHGGGLPSVRRDPGGGTAPAGRRWPGAPAASRRWPRGCSPAPPGPSRCAPAPTRPCGRRRRAPPGAVGPARSGDSITSPGRSRRQRRLDGGAATGAQSPAWHGPARPAPRSRPRRRPGTRCVRPASSWARSAATRSARARRRTAARSAWNWAKDRFSSSVGLARRS